MISDCTSYIIADLRRRQDSGELERTLASFFAVAVAFYLIVGPSLASRNLAEMMV